MSSVIEQGYDFLEYHTNSTTFTVLDLWKTALYSQMQCTFKQQNIVWVGIQSVMACVIEIGYEFPEDHTKQTKNFQGFRSIKTALYSQMHSTFK